MLIRFEVPAFVADRTAAPLDENIVAPATDIVENEHETVVLMEMPGVDRSAVKVSFDRGMLTVSADRRPSESPTNGRLLMQEQVVSGYRRSVRISHPVEPSGLSAKLEDGLLRVSVPKAAIAKPRVIEVR